jgi:adenylate kinase
VNIIVLGAPGAGKGTQAEKIHEKLQIPHIASGDLFRIAVEQGTELGALAKEYMEKGKLVPDEVVAKMVFQRLSENDCNSGWVLEGFPRNNNQAKTLENYLTEVDKVIDKVIFIDVPEDELVRRLSGRLICRNCQSPYHAVMAPPKVPGKCDKCGGELYQRTDDREGVVRERLTTYRDITEPTLQYYKDESKLIVVDGNQEIGKVTQAVLSSIEDCK